MKARKFLMFLVSVGLVFGMMTGCGGGGDDDGDSGGGTTPDTGFTQERVSDQVGDIADELGCTYTVATSAQNTVPDIALSIKTVKAIGKVIQSKRDAPVIAATEPGSCGGSITMPDDLLETMTGTIVLDNYCLSAEDIGAQTIINGSVTLAVNEATNAITASTPTPIRITSTNPNTSESVDVTIDLRDGSLVMNENDGSMDITISSLTVTDHGVGNTYTITNLTVHYSESGITFSGTFDPGTDTGALDVDGNIDVNAATGTITATDTNGVVVILTSTTVEGVFEVEYDNAPLGTMDCSMIAVPEL